MTRIAIRKDNDMKPTSQELAALAYQRWQEAKARAELAQSEECRHTETNKQRLDAKMQYDSYLVYENLRRQHDENTYPKN